MKTVLFCFNRWLWCILYSTTTGAFFIMVSLPLFIYYLYFTCSKEECSLQLWPAHTCDWRDYFDLEAALLFLGWMGLQAFFYLLPIGSVRPLKIWLGVLLSLCLFLSRHKGTPVYKLWQVCFENNRLVFLRIFFWISDTSFWVSKLSIVIKGRERQSTLCPNLWFSTSDDAQSLWTSWSLLTGPRIKGTLTQKTICHMRQFSILL